MNHQRDDVEDARLSFELVLGEFVESVQGLREYTAVIADFLESHHDEQISKRGGGLYPLGFVLAKAVENDPDAASHKWFDTIREAAAAVPPCFADLTNTGAETLNLSETLRTLNRSLRQRMVLHEQALLSLVSSANWFISRLFHLHYQRNPDAVKGMERKFNVEKLSSYESIAAAVSDIIEMQVEQLLRGSLDEWLEQAKALFSLKAGYLDQYRSRLTESYLRRNLLVHNGSVVNSNYIRNVDPDLVSGVTQGQKLSVSPSYLEDAMNVFEISFVLLGLEFWKKVEPAAKARGNFITSQAVTHINAGRYEIAERFSFFGMNDAKIGHELTLYSKINYWQSQKWQGRLDDIRTEVEAFDVSALGDAYGLAKFALLDQSDRFIEQLKRSLKTEQITYAQVETWPLFKEMRRDPRVQDVLSEYGSQAPMPAELKKFGELVAEFIFLGPRSRNASVREDLKDVTPRTSGERILGSQEAVPEQGAEVSNARPRGRRKRRSGASEVASKERRTGS